MFEIKQTGNVIFLLNVKMEERKDKAFAIVRRQTDGAETDARYVPKGLLGKMADVMTALTVRTMNIKLQTNVFVTADMFEIKRTGNVIFQSDANMAVCKDKAFAIVLQQTDGAETGARHVPKGLSDKMAAVMIP
jgi:hypothetical protein